MAVTAWLSISFGGVRCSVHRVTIIRQTGVCLCKYHLVTCLFYHWSAITRGGVIKDGVISGGIAGGDTQRNGLDSVDNVGSRVDRDADEILDGRLVIGVLRQVFGWAISRGEVGHNPMVKKRRAQRYRDRP